MPPFPSLASLSLWSTAFSKPAAQSLNCMAVAISPCKVVSSKLPDLEINFTKARTEVPVTVVDHTEKLPRKSRSLNYAGLIPGSGRTPGEGKGKPLQCSCLENPVDRGTWWAIVHGVAKSCTWLRVARAGARAHTHTHTHTLHLERYCRCFNTNESEENCYPKGAISWFAHGKVILGNDGTAMCDVSSSFSPPLKRPCLIWGKESWQLLIYPRINTLKENWFDSPTTPPSPREVLV